MSQVTRRVFVVVGARPQFMKAAPVMRALAAEPGLKPYLIHTGQHFDAAMSDVFFEELGLPEPDWNLGISGGPHGEMTGRMLEAIERLLITEGPDMVLVFGDTNSTLAGALAAVKLHIPVAHVEAGMRSFDRTMPEEINRVMVDHVSDLLFTPTRSSLTQLGVEGLAERGMHVGDVMYDTVVQLRDVAMARSTIVERLGLTPDGYAVATLHRASTTDEPAALKRAVDYLKARAESLPVVLPLHPRTRAAAAAAEITLDSLIVIDPVGPLDMQRLLASCVEVLTDSGGLQKEAYFHGKPCITLRDRTEWTELVECGWNRLWDQPDFAPRRNIDDYGAGDSSSRIAVAVAAFLGVA